jgi:hypothetical protein
MFSEDSLTFQTWGGIISGALLIAYLMSGRNLGRFAAVFVVTFLLLALLFFGFVRLLVRCRQSDKIYRRIEEELAAVRALSLQEAEQKALTLLLGGEKYRIVEKPALAYALQSLGPLLQQFFSRFEKVTEIKGETSLDRSEIGPSTVREGFIRIGTDMEHAEIVARPNEDVIYAIDGTEPHGPRAEEGFPTIYHYLIAGYSNESNAGKTEGG